MKNIEQTMFTALELMQMKVTTLPTLVEPIIPKRNLVALIGSSDIGKSSLLLQLCMDVALHDTFLGFPIHATHKSSIYVSTEDDQDVLSLRLQKLEDADEEKIKRMRFIFSAENLVDHLDKELTKQKADLVVVDTFTDIYAGEMNQVNQIRTFMSKYNDLSIKHGCVIIFNHHTKKGSEGAEPSKANAIGSAGFESRARLVMELRKDYGDDTKRHLCIVKGNNIGPEYKSRSFELDFDWDKGFTKTGNRKDFAQLVKPQMGRFAKSFANRKVEKEIVFRLHKKGRSLRDMEALMARIKKPVGKTTIGRWLQLSVPQDSLRE